MQNYKILARPEVGKFYKYDRSYIAVIKDIYNKYYIIEDNKDYENPLRYVTNNTSTDTIDELMLQQTLIFTKLGMLTNQYKPGDKFRLRNSDYKYTIITIDGYYSFINEEFEAHDKYDDIETLVRKEFPEKVYKYLGQ